jgi:hypothetical protein
VILDPDRPWAVYRFVLHMYVGKMQKHNDRIYIWAFVILIELSSVLLYSFQVILVLLRTLLSVAFTTRSSLCR